MRKKITLRLLLLVALSASLYSCRNDYFPEKETVNNSSKFRLTSKTIRLEDTKHKVLLGEEVQKVQGKLGKNGNGVSVDTDHVIYIENGPNYYTYTFRIVRENASADAPLENLVLSPLPDGSYKRLLFSYSFTQAEKQSLLNGIPVDTKGKTTITDLDAPSASSKVGMCTYTEETIWHECSEGVHNQSNVFAWGECTADVAPSAYTIAYWNCGSGGGSGDGGTGTDTGDTGGGSTPGSGGCEAEGFENPTDPVSSPGLCGGGVVTQPNVGNNTPENPCEKTKSTLAKPEVQAKISALKLQAQLPAVNPNGGENGFKINTNGNIADASQTSKHEVDYGDLSSSYGAYHNHTLRGTHMLSHRDIDILLTLVKHNSITGPSDAFHGMIAAEQDGSGGFVYLNYIIRFNGSYQEAVEHSFTDEKLDDIKKKYEKAASELKLDALNTNDGGFTLNMEGLQKLFFEGVKLMELENKVILQRIDGNKVEIISLNSDGSTKGIPCP
ncbi:hypothetical protein ACQWU4_14925 [Chryseobacterium sp. MIQD13]|uniref:hypothetical protein n=1 Tax=Chryseobacterium sp. MIQD13 TaxID=3422310 RepID=UPI003D2A4750